MMIAQSSHICSNDRYIWSAVRTALAMDSRQGKLDAVELKKKGEAMSEERAVQQVLARYVRGTDARDGAAVAAVFTEDGRVDLL
jgi:hypothetical protein